MKKIKSFNEACEALNQSSEIPTFPMLSKIEEKAMQAHFMLVIIIRALNENWEPDWSNEDEYKYYNYFWMGVGSSGFRFSDSFCTFTCTDTDVGSRLCFKSRELAIYAGKQFQDLYESYLLIKK